jgi:hypothetical protein
MSVRKRPCLTRASLAARRANDLKSTRPRTERGQARIILNLSSTAGGRWPCSKDWHGRAAGRRRALLWGPVSEFRGLSRDRRTALRVTPTVRIRPSTGSTWMIAVDSLRSNPSSQPPEAPKISERSRNVTDMKRFVKICRSSVARNHFGRGRKTREGELGANQHWSASERSQNIIDAKRLANICRPGPPRKGPYPAKQAGDLDRGWLVACGQQRLRKQGGLFT